MLAQAPAIGRQVLALPQALAYRGFDRYRQDGGQKGIGRSVDARGLIAQHEVLFPQQVGHGSDIATPHGRHFGGRVAADALAPEAAERTAPCQGGEVLRLDDLPVGLDGPARIDDGAPIKAVLEEVAQRLGQAAPARLQVGIEVDGVLGREI